MAIDQTEPADDWLNTSTGPADQLQRNVLQSLQEAGVPLSLADLALELARREPGADEDDVWDRADCYWVELFHSHVPALEAAGLVEYHAERRTVALSGTAERSFDGPVGAPVQA